MNKHLGAGITIMFIDILLKGENASFIMNYNENETINCFNLEYFIKGT